MIFRSIVLLQLIIFFLIPFHGNYCQKAPLVQCNPTNWWIGMQHNKVQLLIYSKGKSLSKITPVLEYDGVQILKVHRFKNPQYMAIDLMISNQTKPGVVHIQLGSQLINWPLAKKNLLDNGKNFAQGLQPVDFIYLIMPDRFANGDTTNDRIPGMKDQSLNRDTVFNRHGGDLLGIINHLGYFNQLGVTALWLNPVLENDMPDRTEHGYAITDHYRIDPRLGSNETYKALIKTAHQNGLKIIQDMIYNHAGLQHWIIQDLPDSNWLHQWNHYTNTSYKDQVLYDPHAAMVDQKIMSDGWFTPQMPDWNQSNEFVKNFLLQHALWCIEEFGVDAYRVDTYAYNDLNFMNELNNAILSEYPSFFIFGETWVHGVVNQSYFARNNYVIPFKSNLQSVTDFQLLWGINDAMTKQFGWTDGVNKLYTTLAQDFVYQKPENNVIFLSNHDLSRAWSTYGENIAKMKSALCWLLTTRGIPQLYYGEEVLMPGVTYPNDGYVRKDFPGGWIGDKQNKFLISDRSPQENEIWKLISTLANYRKYSKALSIGQLIQYVPMDGIYVYFRQYESEKIMVIMNTNDNSKNIQFDRFSDQIKNTANCKNLLTDEIITTPKELQLNPWETHVFLLIPKK